MCHPKGGGEEQPRSRVLWNIALSNLGLVWRVPALKQVCRLKFNIITSQQRGRYPNRKNSLLVVKFSNLYLITHSSFEVTPGGGDHRLKFNVTATISG